MISIIRVNDNLDITNQIAWDSVQIQDNLTSQCDTLRFSTIKYGTLTLTPEVGEEIQVFDGVEKIFGGTITRIDRDVAGDKILVYNVECQDYSYLLNGKLVPDTFENHTIEAIIADIITLYAPVGFTVNNVVTTGITLENILFDYKTISECIQELAELIGYDWYVDYDKDIHFFSKTTGETAPFNITEGAEPLFRDLIINEDLSQVRNVIYLRGAEYAGNSTADKVGTADNVTKSFILPFRYDNTPTVTVNGSPVTVGVDGLDSEDSFDCLWNYNEKIIKFKTPPVSGNVIVTGMPLILLLVKSQSGASRAVYGDREYRIVDKDIKTKDLARKRVQAELIDYANPIREGSFTCYESGLKAGMRIDISAPSRAVNEDFIISSISKQMLSPMKFYYIINITTSRKFGIIEYLKSQFDWINKRIGTLVNEEEVVDVIISLEDIDTLENSDEIFINRGVISLQNLDTIPMIESLLRAIKDSPPTWVAGPYSPTGNSDRKRPMFCDKDNMLV